MITPNAPAKPQEIRMTSLATANNTPALGRINYASLLGNPNNLTADQLRRASAIAGELASLGLSLADARRAAEMTVADVAQIIRSGK